MKYVTSVVVPLLDSEVYKFNMLNLNSSDKTIRINDRSHYNTIQLPWSTDLKVN